MKEEQDHECNPKFFSGCCKTCNRDMRGDENVIWEKDEWKLNRTMNTPKTGKMNISKVMKSAEAAGEVIRKAEMRDWEDKLWNLLEEEYGDVGQNGNVRDFIESLLADREREVIEDILFVSQKPLSHGVMLLQGDDYVLVKRIKEYVKSQGITLSAKSREE